MLAANHEPPSGYFQLLLLNAAAVLSSVPPGLSCGSACILGRMGVPRVMLLFDPEAHPQCWNERMVPGEFAVLYTGSQPRVLEDGSLAWDGTVPTCTVFSSLSEAEAYAARQVVEVPTLRCRIYDDKGLAGQPVRQISGTQHKGESEISSRFRRWCGSILLLGGIALGVVDWQSDFTRLWPGTLGVRMIPVGLILLVTELVIVIEAKRKKRRTERAGS
jgi:hypothetical protein